MKRIRSQLSIAVVCCILGFIVSYQLKNIASQESKIPISNTADITEEIKQLKSQKKDFTDKIDEMQKKIDDYEKLSSNANSASQQLYNDLEKTRAFSGELDVEGQGIIITITPKNLSFSTGVENWELIKHDALVYIVNELNFAGAEAISINDIRITNFTGIRTSSGGLYILIGKEKISPIEKIVIKAIGDKDNIFKDISLPGVFQYVPNGTYIKPNVEKVDKIKILKSNDTYTLTYAKPVKK